MSLRLEVEKVTKRFTGKPVFAQTSFTASPGEILAIVGSNGSGKSTLLKIVAGVLSPSSGSATWYDNEKKIDSEDLSQRIGYVAPYLELYNELTALEHINFVGQLKARNTSVEDLTQFGLDRTIAESSRLVGQYSSGMRQRVALGMAATGDPDVLFYDEPSSNLDEAGIERLFEYIISSAQQGKIIFLATNDSREHSLAHKHVELLPY